jgi:hypothetical protein
VLIFLYRWLTFHVFLQVAEFFYNDQILGQAGRKIGESVGSISRGPTPEVTVLNPSDLIGKVKTCFSQKRYGRVID